MLEFKEVYDSLQSKLEVVIPKVVELAVTHRETVITGRTHSVAALPTTFGLKVAGWADELLRHYSRLKESRSRIMVAQLHGGVGTMAAFDGYGPKLIQAFARRLDLGVPSIGWHTIRDRIAEYATVLAMLAATLGRIADEIRTLSRAEIGELELAWLNGQVGSSTMPHKRNPEDCEQIVVLARLARAQVPLALEAMMVEHERDYRGTRLEWPALGELAHYTLASISIFEHVLAILIVKPDGMERNVLRVSRHVCTEALVVELGKKIGKQSAYEFIFELSQESIDLGEDFKTVAYKSDKIRAILSAERLDFVFNPRNHLGAYNELIDAVIADVAREGLVQQTKKRTKKAS